MNNNLYDMQKDAERWRKFYAWYSSCKYSTPYLSQFIATLLGEGE